MFQLLNPIIDDLNAALAAHGLKIVMISPPAISVPNTHSEQAANLPDPHPNAVWNDSTSVPKDYAVQPEEGGHTATQTDLQRKQSRLARLISRGKP